MNETVLNTAAEMRYRMLLLLASLPTDDYSARWLSGMDFIVEYGSIFGISKTNLHGDNWMKFTEYATKIFPVTDGLLDLAYRGWVRAIPTPKGFLWRITEAGEAVADQFDISYADDYGYYARLAWRKYQEMDDAMLDEMIRKKAMSPMEKEESHG